MISSPASMVTEKKVTRWQAKGDLRALAEALCDLKLSTRRPEVCEAARKALAGGRREALPSVLAALRGQTVSSLKGCRYLLEAVQEAGLADDAAPVLRTLLEQDPYWFSVDDAALGRCVEICKGVVATRLAFAGFVSTEVGKSHPETLAKARACLKEIESPRDDFERLVSILLKTRDRQLLGILRPLFEHLGADSSNTASLERAPYARPDKAVKQYRRLIAALDSQAAKVSASEAAFLKSWVLQRFKQAFADAVKVTVPVSGEYQYPNVCAACLSETAVSLHELKRVIKDSTPSADVITKTTWKAHFPVCNRCRSVIDDAVAFSTLGGISFSNPRYGFAFATANNLRDYTCVTTEQERSSRLADHLTRLGLPDMSRGIDWEAARSFHGL